MSLKQTNTSAQCKIIGWSKLDDTFWPFFYQGPLLCLLRTTLYHLLESGLFGRQNETCGAIRPPCHAKEPLNAETS